KGVFVTTSTFRSGAKRTAKRLAEAGYPIELLDAEALLRELGIAQLRTFEPTAERVTSYALSSGEYLGVGLNRDFVPGEDLREREIAGRLWLGDDLRGIGDSANTPTS